MEQITIRKYKQEDKSFVINSWLKSFKDQSFAKEVPKEIYYKFHAKIVTDILERSTTIPLVAVSKDDEDLIVGYGVFERLIQKDVFHYLYVKRAFNNLGIARLIIAEYPFQPGKRFASHISKSGRKFLDKSGLIYNPYLQLGE